MPSYKQLKTLRERLDQILPRIESADFRENRGLGNEIGFYIFDYPASAELEVREHLSTISKKLKKRGRVFASINLFEIIMEILDSRNLTERAFKLQLDRGDDALFNALKGPLEQNRVAEFIADKANLEQSDFILLHGLGSAWPLIRGHGLLNALHARVGSVPTVLFYPGDYDGAMLKPFGTIDSNNYYRAFKLVP